MLPAFRVEHLPPHKGHHQDHPEEFSPVDLISIFFAAFKFVTHCCLSFHWFATFRILTNMIVFLHTRLQLMRVSHAAMITLDHISRSIGRRELLGTIICNHTLETRLGMEGNGALAEGRAAR